MSRRAETVVTQSRLEQTRLRTDYLVAGDAPLARRPSTDLALTNDQFLAQLLGIEAAAPQQVGRVEIADYGQAMGTVSAFRGVIGSIRKANRAFQRGDFGKTVNDHENADLKRQFEADPLVSARLSQILDASFAKGSFDSRTFNKQLKAYESELRLADLKTHEASDSFEQRVACAGKISRDQLNDLYLSSPEGAKLYRKLAGSIAVSRLISLFLGKDDARKDNVAESIPDGLRIIGQNTMEVAHETALAFVDRLKKYRDDALVVIGKKETTMQGKFAIVERLLTSTKLVTGAFELVMQPAATFAAEILYRTEFLQDAAELLEIGWTVSGGRDAAKFLEYKWKGYNTGAVQDVNRAMSQAISTGAMFGGLQSELALGITKHLSMLPTTEITHVVSKLTHIDVAQITSFTQALGRFLKPVAEFAAAQKIDLAHVLATSKTTNMVNSGLQSVFKTLAAFRDETLSNSEKGILFLHTLAGAGLIGGIEMSLMHIVPGLFPYMMATEGGLSSAVHRSFQEDKARGRHKVEDERRFEAFEAGVIAFFAGSPVVAVAEGAIMVAGVVGMEAVHIANDPVGAAHRLDQLTGGNLESTVELALGTVQNRGVEVTDSRITESKGVHHDLPLARNQFSVSRVTDIPEGTIARYQVVEVGGSDRLAFAHNPDGTTADRVDVFSNLDPKNLAVGDTSGDYTGKDLTFDRAIVVSGEQATADWVARTILQNEQAHPGDNYYRVTCVDGSNDKVINVFHGDNPQARGDFSFLHSAQGDQHRIADVGEAERVDVFNFMRDQFKQWREQGLTTVNLDDLSDPRAKSVDDLIWALANDPAHIAYFQGIKDQSNKDQFYRFLYEEVGNNQKDPVDAVYLAVQRAFADDIPVPPAEASRAPAPATPEQPAAPARQEPAAPVETQTQPVRADVAWVQRAVDVARGQNPENYKNVSSSELQYIEDLIKSGNLTQDQVWGMLAEANQSVEAAPAVAPATTESSPQPSASAGSNFGEGAHTVVVNGVAVNYSITNGRASIQNEGALVSQFGLNNHGDVYQLVLKTAAGETDYTAARQYALNTKMSDATVLSAYGDLATRQTYVAEQVNTNVEAQTAAPVASRETADQTPAISVARVNEVFAAEAAKYPNVSSAEIQSLRDAASNGQLTEKQLWDTLFYYNASVEAPTPAAEPATSTTYYAESTNGPSRENPYDRVTGSYSFDRGAVNWVVDHTTGVDLHSVAHLIPSEDAAYKIAALMTDSHLSIEDALAQYGVSPDVTRSALANPVDTTVADASWVQQVYQNGKNNGGYGGVTRPEVTLIANEVNERLRNGQHLTRMDVFVALNYMNQNEINAPEQMGAGWASGARDANFTPDGSRDIPLDGRSVFHPTNRLTELDIREYVNHIAAGTPYTPLSDAIARGQWDQVQAIFDTSFTETASPALQLRYLGDDNTKVPFSFRNGQGYTDRSWTLGEIKAKYGDIKLVFADTNGDGKFTEGVDQVMYAYAGTQRIGCGNLIPTSQPLDVPVPGFEKIAPDGSPIEGIKASVDLVIDGEVKYHFEGNSQNDGQGNATYNYDTAAVKTIVEQTLRDNPVATIEMKLNENPADAQAAGYVPVDTSAKFTFQNGAWRAGAGDDSDGDGRAEVVNTKTPLPDVVKWIDENKNGVLDAGDWRNAGEELEVRIGRLNGAEFTYTGQESLFVSSSDDGAYRTAVDGGSTPSAGNGQMLSEWLRSQGITNPDGISIELKERLDANGTVTDRYSTDGEGFVPSKDGAYAVTYLVYKGGQWVHSFDKWGVQVIEENIGAGSGANAADILNKRKECFTAGTKITLANGKQKAIEAIKVGDGVKAFDEKSGKIVDSKVAKLFVHPETAGYLRLTVGTGKYRKTINVTPNHCVYLNNEWKQLYEAKVGDTLRTEKGRKTKIVKIETIDKVVTTYNFEVETYHNYLAEGVVVHNQNKGGREVDEGGAGIKDGGGDQGGDGIKDPGGL